MTEELKISSDELAVYDRQIRLWGIDAQNRLRNAKAFIYGMSLLGAEVAKNLMLCGLKKLTIADDTIAKEPHFLMEYKPEVDENRAIASEKKLKALNPMVKVDALNMSTNELNSEFLKEFDIVILIDQDENIIKEKESICRQLKIRFITGGVFGWIGYSFFDFNGFEFLVPAPKNHTLVDESGDKVNGNSCNDIDTVTLEDDDAKVKKTFEYPTFEEAVRFDIYKLTRGFIRKNKPGTFLLINALLMLKNQYKTIPTSELIEKFINDADDVYKNVITPPVLGKFEFLLDPPLPSTCSIVGGVLSQEAIKSITQNDEPHRNYFTYNAVEAMGYVYNTPLF